MKTKEKVKIGKVNIFRIVIIMVSCIIVGVATIGLFKADNEASKTIDVIRFKNEVQRGYLIEEQDIYKYAIAIKEFNSYTDASLNSGSIYTWDKKDDVVGKYASNYVRKESYVFSDTLSEERIISTPYLYSLDNKEFLRLDITQDYGQIVVPGDKIRVRASYREGNAGYEGLMSENVKSIDVFEEAIVTDMLNSSGQSIFDIFNNLRSLSASEREAKLANESFLETVKADCYIVSLTAEQVKKYNEIKINNPIFTTTILERSTEVLDYVENVIEQIQFGIGKRKEE